MTREQILQNYEAWKQGQEALFGLFELRLNLERDRFKSKRIELDQAIKDIQHEINEVTDARSELTEQCLEFFGVSGYIELEAGVILTVVQTVNGSFFLEMQRVD